MQDDKTKEKFLELRAQLFNQIRDPNVVMRFYMVRDAADENTDYEFHTPLQVVVGSALGLVIPFLMGLIPIYQAYSPFFA